MSIATALVLIEDAARALYAVNAGGAADKAPVPASIDDAPLEQPTIDEVQDACAPVGEACDCPKTIRTVLILDDGTSVALSALSEPRAVVDYLKQAKDTGTLLIPFADDLAPEGSRKTTWINPLAVNAVTQDALPF